jgi:hypothetical protein
MVDVSFRIGDLEKAQQFSDLGLERQADEIRAAFSEWQKWYWYQYVKKGCANGVRYGREYDFLLLPLIEEIERREGLTIGKKNRDLFSLAQRYDADYVDAVLQHKNITVDDPPTEVSERCRLPKEAALMRAKWERLKVIPKGQYSRFFDTLDKETVSQYGIVERQDCLGGPDRAQAAKPEQTDDRLWLRPLTILKLVAPERACKLKRQFDAGRRAYKNLDKKLFAGHKRQRTYCFDAFEFCQRAVEKALILPEDYNRIEPTLHEMKMKRQSEPCIGSVI